MKRLLFMLALFVSLTTCAKENTHKYDTIPAKKECIVKYLTQETTNTKGAKIVKYFVVYSCDEFQEILPMTQSVYEYVHQCLENGIKPTLGIKLRDGEPCGIVRIRKKIR